MKSAELCCVKSNGVGAGGASSVVIALLGAGRMAACANPPERLQLTLRPSFTGWPGGRERTAFAPGSLGASLGVGGSRALPFRR